RAGPRETVRRTVSYNPRPGCGAAPARPLRARGGRPSREPRPSVARAWPRESVAGRWQAGNGRLDFRLRKMAVRPVEGGPPMRFRSVVGMLALVAPLAVAVAADGVHETQAALRHADGDYQHEAHGNVGLREGSDFQRFSEVG